MFFPSSTKRFVFFLILDTIAFTLSLYLSFLVYFEVSKSVDYLKLMREVLPFFVVSKLGFFLLFRIYRSTWRYFGIVDLFNVIVALAASNLILLAGSLIATTAPPSDSMISLAFPLSGFPKSIIFMDFTVSLVLLSFLRISKRFYLEAGKRRGPSRLGKRTLILGAGNTGEMILRDMARQSFRDFKPVAFLDDDRSKAGATIHGVRILGGIDQLEATISQDRIEALVIAIPSLGSHTLRSLFESAKKLNIDTVKIVPRIYDFNKPQVNLKSLEDIAIEDLIGRQSVTVNFQAIAAFLKNKSVLITGAGGSIGSEIVVQVCGFEPREVILFDIDETELHNLGLRLDRLFSGYPLMWRFVTGDVRDEKRVREVFENHRPDIVFHAAAYKHVPMMEYNPGEAVKVNIFGTHIVADAAVRSGVDKFIMISTDKAVRPTSVMGATKRIAEYVCKAFNDNVAGGRRQEAGGEETACEVNARTMGPSDDKGAGAYPDSTNQPINQSTKFVSVRFGNVLGSRGSVLPLFLEQLKRGGPLTVTHPDMKRYFMTIPEAVSLVLQAAVIGSGGEVLVLDMGEPTYITDIAAALARMHGLEPGKDIDIQYTGMRPGEKLFEEILTAEEGTDASMHEKIFVAKNGQAYSPLEIRKIIAEFQEVMLVPASGRDYFIRTLLRRYVKYYEGDEGIESNPVTEPAVERNQN
jgi:FlaA1/EpsC-like NDP-sugar epimerase